jgi:hypothetical protein
MMPITKQPSPEREEALAYEGEPGQPQPAMLTTSHSVYAYHCATVLSQEVMGWNKGWERFFPFPPNFQSSAYRLLLLFIRLLLPMFHVFSPPSL